MNNMFSRTASLLGEEAIQKLQKSKVAVFGIGGVGSYTLEALARSGVGNIDVFDCDRVDITNLNRQIIATNENIGNKKTDEAIKRAKLINENINIRGFDIFYDEKTAEDINLSEYGFIVDAIDSVSSKIELIVRAREKGVPIISCMGTGNKLDPTKIRIDDIYKTSVCPLARVMRSELKKRGIKKLPVVWSDEIPIESKATDTKADGKKAPASAVFVPAAAGIAIASFAVKEIIKDN